MGERDAEGSKQPVCEPDRARRCTAAFTWQPRGFTPALPRERRPKEGSDGVKPGHAGLVCSRVGAGALFNTVLMMFSCSGPIRMIVPLLCVVLWLDSSCTPQADFVSVK